MSGADAEGPPDAVPRETNGAEESQSPGALPAARPDVVVAVRDLKMDYGAEAQSGPALDGVSFDVAAGEIFGLIGPNGAGKTTTIRILATLLEPTAGEVRIAGHCVMNDIERVRSLVGYMPDQFGVYDGNTVEEYLEFFAGAFKVPPAARKGIVADVMTLTDLHVLKGRMVSDLSRGMKQRLCLAKTLVHDPQVLILDEPASALDPRARVEMRALLKELSRMGKTIVISSHILSELSDLCSSVAILEKGRLIESGSVERLRGRRAGNRRVRMRLASPHEAAAGLLEGHSLVQEVRAQGRELEFEYAGAPAEFYRIVKLLVDQGVPLVAIEQDSGDLETLFMELTRGDVQ